MRGRDYLRKLPLQVTDALVGRLPALESRLQLLPQHVALCHCGLRPAPRVIHLAHEVAERQRVNIQLITGAEWVNYVTAAKVYKYEK